MSAKDGGQAFPSGDNDSKAPYELGMTLRDYFAGQALAGFATRLGVERLSHTHVATTAYELADAMLAARAMEQAQ